MNQQFRIFIILLCISALSFPILGQVYSKKTVHTCDTVNYQQLYSFPYLTIKTGCDRTIFFNKIIQDWGEPDSVTWNKGRIWFRENISSERNATIIFEDDTQTELLFAVFDAQQKCITAKPEIQDWITGMAETWLFSGKQIDGNFPCINDTIIVRSDYNWSSNWLDKQENQSLAIIQVLDIPWQTYVKTDTSYQIKGTQIFVRLLGNVFKTGYPFFLIIDENNGEIYWGIPDTSKQLKIVGKSMFMHQPIWKFMDLDTNGVPELIFEQRAMFGNLLSVYSWNPALQQIVFSGRFWLTGDVSDDEIVLQVNPDHTFEAIHNAQSNSNPFVKKTVYQFVDNQLVVLSRTVEFIFPFNIRFGRFRIVWDNPLLSVDEYKLRIVEETLMWKN